ncbi:hypothetical protein FHG87_018681 [Trinorchestia longiramus]|nr:hypothetical protein FHG87_018681 [Trinorchestia longiramus]
MPPHRSPLRRLQLQHEAACSCGSCAVLLLILEATRPNKQRMLSVFLKVVRHPGGIEEMQGGGRRVRFEWRAYITV